MFGFFKSFFGNSVNDSQIAEEAAQAMDALDIQMAKAAHENWKIRLQAYLDGASTEDLSAETICFDDRCDLGQWIYGPGQQRLGRFPGFTALKGHHKMFHYAASNVVALAKAGREDEARKMLNTQFAGFSKNVIAELEQLEAIVTEVKKIRRKRA
ncbi:chemoreceptor zinc-binding protein [Tibeticola sediminis]|uniref:Chemoreceptor zinc-binding protein n=1 Tax=Tibeticola sediminis TaxID=1917811 RepID=A0A3N4UR67_9BURK|nr:CZB domain-containing protein [Tibeticola sediminis]RPE73182.1 chemoreceptor zinc-binding protein [Tibeticola sediminis]